MQIPTLVISLTFTSLLMILMIPLSSQITLRRIKLGNVQLGHANDEELHRKIRAHGNFIEYAPLGLIGLAILEYHVGASVALWSLGSILLSSRIIHAISITYSRKTPSPWTVLAMTLSHAYFLIIGLWLLYIATR